MFTGITKTIEDRRPNEFIVGQVNPAKSMILKYNFA